MREHEIIYHGPKLSTTVTYKLQIKKPKEHWSELKYRKINKIKTDFFFKRPHINSV